MRVALALGLALAAARAAAQQLPVCLYPLTGDGAKASSVAEVQALLRSAVPGVAGRSRRLVPATPLVLASSCGIAPVADCLARFAKGGIVVTGTVREAGPLLVVTLRATDSDARVYGPVETAVDSFVQNAHPLTEALLDLERRLPEAGAPSIAREAEESRASRVKAPALAAQPPPEPATRIAPPIRYKDTPAVPGLWRRAAGGWATGIGVALLAGGITVAALNKRLAEDLDRRYGANELTASDAAKYAKVDAYNVLSAALLATGGTATAVGLYFWGTAPDVETSRGGAGFGVHGRF